MSIEIKVPMLPESVSDATVIKWHKKAGDAVARDENVVDLETEKIVLEVPAVAAGVIEKILVPEGEVVESGVVLAILQEGGAEKSAAAAKAPEEKVVQEAAVSEEAPAVAKEGAISPAVRRLLEEEGVDIDKVSGSGKGGRITKQDVLDYIRQAKAVAQQPAASAAKSTTAASKPATTAVTGERNERRVPMSRLRARIAERLVEVQQSAAILTTFNEVNMYPVMELRKRYKDAFEKKHGVRLGFMSFFVKAVVEALKNFPSVNASIDGSDVLYHDYFDIGIAVSSPRGLVVPVLRDVDAMSMADIEQGIREYAQKAKDAKLTMEEMTGGTFTVTNGGVFGSMLSTPIINPPQSAILGMHNIVERPVVENGEIVARPVMYLALSYDHRIVDGRESVSFLVAIKQILEDPARLLLQV